jgi:hypothetical protein
MPIGTQILVPITKGVFPMKSWSRIQVVIVLLALVVVFGIGSWAIPALLAAPTPASANAQAGAAPAGVPDKSEYMSHVKLNALSDLAKIHRELVDQYLISQNVPGISRELVLSYLDRANRLQDHVDQLNFRLVALPKGESPERTAIQAEIELAQKYKVEALAMCRSLDASFRHFEILERSARAAQDALDQARIQMAMRAGDVVK